MKLKIGILALQGAFAEHRKMMESLGAEVIELRRKTDLSKSCNALILPGGESTVQGKLLRELDMFNILKRRICSGLPVMATCAGTILLAEKLHESTVTHFATLPITVRRNAYGRQLSSFYTDSEFAGIPDIPMPFIRAPEITGIDRSVEVLATFNGQPTAVRHGNQLAMTFHPEITNSSEIHRYFLENIVIPRIKI